MFHSSQIHELGSPVRMQTAETTDEVTANGLAGDDVIEASELLAARLVFDADDDGDNVLIQ